MLLLKSRALPTGLIWRGVVKLELSFLVLTVRIAVDSILYFHLSGLYNHSVVPPVAAPGGLVAVGMPSLDCQVLRVTYSLNALSLCWVVAMLCSRLLGKRCF